MSLCEACVKLSKELSAVIAAGYHDKSSQRYIRHSRPFTEVRSVKFSDCPLCWLLQDRYVREAEDELLDDTFAAEVFPSWTPVDTAHSFANSDALRYRLKLLYVVVRKDVPRPKTLDGYLKSSWSMSRVPIPLQLFASKDCEKPLKERLWGRDLSYDAGLHHVITLCQMQFKSCCATHAICDPPLFDGWRNHSLQNRLPTRVIDTAPVDGKRSLRLVETNGQTGSWVALSHCWGKPGNQPLTTTKGNIHNHRDKIDFDALPRTFRDAVILTRALDVRYLWIDSLCIIQDDKNDWQRESGKMGDIYEHCILNISAGHARDSTEGIFSDYSKMLVEPAQQTPTEEPDKTTPENSEAKQVPLERDKEVLLPFFRADKLVGSFSISSWLIERGKEETTLESSPLFKRAWVMQEWALSRRTLIFLGDSIVWWCRTLCVDEGGFPLKLRRPSLDNWDDLISEYTQMDVTFESDRLVAIQGLVNLLRMKRPDDYFAGTWTGDLPDSLLWRVRDGSPCKLATERSHLPSWTWASLEGPVFFQLSGSPRRTHGGEQLSNIVERWSLQSTGALRLRGPMALLDPRGLEFYARDDFNHPYKSIFKLSFWGHSNCRQNGGGVRERNMVAIPVAAWLRKRYEEPECAGWATLDLGVVPEHGSVHALAVKMETNGFETWRQAKEHVYHILVLHSTSRAFPLDGAPRYKRIGMGVVRIACLSWDVSDAEIV